MRSLDELKELREENRDKDFEIGNALLKLVEDQFISGRQSFKYLAGKTHKEQSLYWERCCDFVHLAFVSYSSEKEGHMIELTFIDY